MVLTIRGHGSQSLENFIINQKMVNAALIVPLLALLARASTIREWMRIGMTLMAIIAMEYDMEPRTLGFSELNTIPSRNIAFYLLSRLRKKLHHSIVLRVHLKLALIQSLNRLFACLVLCSVLDWASWLHILGMDIWGVKIWLLN